MRHAFYTLITPHLTPAEAIAEAVRLGFHGLEWRVAIPGEPIPGPQTYWEGNRCSLDPAKLEVELPRAVGLARDAGLESISICPYVFPDETATLQRLFAIAASSGVPWVRVSVPVYDRNRSYQEQFTALRQQMTIVADLARRAGVRACLLQHAGSLLPSASATARLIADLDPAHVGIYLDVGHYVREGYEDFGIVVDLLADHLAEIHLRNGWLRAAGTADGVSLHPPVPHWGRLAEGQVPLGLLADALSRRGWDGWLVLEDFSDRPQLQRMTEGIATMRSLSHAARRVA